MSRQPEEVRLLILDHAAVSVFCRAELENDWFVDFPLTSEIAALRRIRIDDKLYFLSRKADERSRLLVIGLTPAAPFGDLLNPQYVFSRILHVALSHLERTVAIPLSWKTFTDEALISVYAYQVGVGHGERIHFDRNPNGQDHIFAYALTQQVEKFSEVPRDIPKFSGALDGFLDALLAAADLSSSSVANVGSGITLDSKKDKGPRAWSLKEWLESRLTKDQRDFVNRPHDGPVRLRGAAGTGKTLAMAIKCLKDSYDFEDQKREARIAFITHSVQMANERVRDMFFEGDPSERWADLRHAKIELKSLYDIAQAILGYDTKGVRPISLDGAEGREYQKIYIGDAVDGCLSDLILRTRFLPDLSFEFRDQLTSQFKRDRLLSDLSNEFASIIDAEGVRLGNDKAEDYLVRDREGFQMPLGSRADREIILRIHQRYCDALVRDNFLSMDQMVADLNSYLQSNEWRVRRNDVGYDLIFVDELHYFNKAERMIFHMLFKSTAVRSSGRVPMFMAYDLKQSPSDVFLSNQPSNSPANFFKSLGAGETDLVELKTVFRNTPQISRFLADLDGAFPALNLEGEWAEYDVVASEGAGEIPTLRTFETPEKMLDYVFASASDLARAFGGRDVAVLCLNGDLFSKYLKVGRISGKFHPIDSRDKIAEIKFAGRRPLFSTPDYVAGLQFKVVYLIHFDRAETREPNDHVGARRRFVSRCYSGASRAVERLTIVACEDRAGYSEILEAPLKSGSLIKV